jgi:signal transduction histidine kinase
VQAKVDDLWVEHSHNVIENLQMCFLAERELGTRAREYVLTGEDQYLKFYQIEVINLAKSIRRIEELTADNTLQQQRIRAQLRPLIDERLSFLSLSLFPPQLAAHQSAIAILLQNNALDLIEKIRKIIEDMQQEERKLLQIRLAQHAESSQRLHTIILFGSATAVIFVIMAAMQLHRDVIIRQRVEGELRLSEAALKRQAEELLAANKELESFSYSVSHDLRAPLRGIEGFSELILATYKDRLDDQGQGYFDRICAAAKRMGILIDEILNLSRITRSPLVIQNADLAVLARDIVTDLQKSTPYRHVTWKIPDRLPVQGDAALLSIALMNLLSNAWKFTGSKH